MLWIRIRFLCDPDPGKNLNADPGRIRIHELGQHNGERNASVRDLYDIYSKLKGLPLEPREYCAFCFF